MVNRQGKTVNKRLHEDVEYLEQTADYEKRKMLAIKVLGAADLAVEFNLITYKEWEKHIEKIFKIM